MKFRKESEMTLGNLSTTYIKWHNKLKFFFSKLLQNQILLKIRSFAVQNPYINFQNRIFVSSKDIEESLHTDAPKTWSEYFLSEYYFSIHIGTNSNWKENIPEKPFSSWCLKGVFIVLNLYIAPHFLPTLLAFFIAFFYLKLISNL